MPERSNKVARFKASKDFKAVVEAFVTLVGFTFKASRNPIFIALNLNGAYCKWE